MKKKFILLPLCLLVLGACAPDAGEQTTTPGGEGTSNVETSTDIATEIEKAPDDGKVYQVVETAPEVGTVYKLGAYQGNKKKNIFASGYFDDSGYRFTTYDHGYEGADFQVEDAGEGKFYLAVTPYKGTKTYVNMDYDFHHLKMGAAETKWTYNEDHNTLTFVAKKGDGTPIDHFIGTYQNWTTLSGCAIDQIADDFVAHFYTGVPSVPATGIEIEDLGRTTYYKGAKIKIGATLLPSNGVGKITWSVAPADKGVAFNKWGELEIAKDATATEVTVTAKVSDTVLDTVTLTIAEANLGTAEAPIKVSEAIDVIDGLGGAKTEGPAYITGTVTKNKVLESKTYDEGKPTEVTKQVMKEVWLSHDVDVQNTEAFELYNAEFDAAVTGFGAKENDLAGKTVVVKAGLQKYNTTYETYKSAVILSAKTPEVIPDATDIKVATTGEVRSNEPLTIGVEYLPNPSQGEVEFALKEAVTGVAVSAEGVVTVEETVAADTTAVVTVTLKGAEPAVVKEVTVTVKKALNLGTAEAPIDAAAFMTSIDTQTKDRLSTVKYYLKGIVGFNYKVGDDGVQSVYITDGNYAKKIYIKATYKDGIGADYAEENTLYGKEITVEGYGKWYESRGYHNYKLENAVVTSIADPAEPIVATAIELETSYTVSTGKTVQLAPTFKPCGANPAVTYTVTGNDKVTVSETGLVTVAEDATATDATITAKVSESVKTTTTIKVDVKLPGQKDVTWDVAAEFANHKKDEAFAGFKVGNVNITAAGADCKWYNNDLRMYNGCTMTFTGEGVKILKVIIHGSKLTGEAGNADTVFVSNSNGDLIIKSKTDGGNAALAWKKTSSSGGPITKITIVTVPAE